MAGEPSREVAGQVAPDVPLVEPGVSSGVATVLIFACYTEPMRMRDLIARRWSMAA
jgi:hypothetical protein